MNRRILYTLPDLHFGGAANLLAQNFMELSRENTTFLVYFGSKSEMQEKFQKAGVEPRRISYNGMKDLFSTTRRLRKYIIKQNIDIVHTNLFLDKFIVALATRGLNIKTITTIHAADISKYKSSFKKRILFLVDNFLHNQVYDKTIVVSKAAHAIAVHQRKLNPEKLEVVINGIPPIQKFGEKIYNPNLITLGTTCRFQPIKGLPRLLHLFALLVESSTNFRYKLLLIGDGPEKPKLIEMTKDLGIEDRVEFIGFTNNIALYLYKIDYYINSSYSEALPVSVLEALSIGKPVIASDVGGLPEVVENNYNGILVDFNDLITSLKKIEEFLILSSNDYSKFSRNAENSYIKKFSDKNYSRQLLQIYSKV